jgi:hypothetical protein
MSVRALGVLALAVLVATSALWWLDRSGGMAEQADRTGGQFLPGLSQQLERVSGVRAVRGGGELLADVARRPEGWVVTNRWDYPADPATLRSLLDGLARARRVARKGADADARAALGVGAIAQADPATLALTLEGIDDGLTVIVGEAAAGGAEGTYVRRADAERAWRVEPVLERPERIADWLDDALVDLPAERIAEVRIEPAEGAPVRVSRPDGPSGPFRLRRPADREPLSDSIARSLARVPAGLTLVDVRPVRHTGALALQARARYRTFDGLVVEIATYAPNADEGEHYARLRARADAGADTDVAARARELDARWRAWAYRMPDYKRINATRRLADVLK